MFQVRSATKLRHWERFLGGWSLSLSTKGY